mgnify:CR=1 FL=1
MPPLKSFLVGAIGTIAVLCMLAKKQATTEEELERRLNKVPTEHDERC